MTEHPDMECAAVDELAASYALGAVDPSDEAAIGSHLATCDRPHVEARSFIGVASVLQASLEAVEPSPELRRRLMATVAETAQEHRPAPPSVGPTASAVEPRRLSWWRANPWPSGIAAAGLAAAVALGAWGVSLNTQLAERNAALEAVASADAIHAASGSAGSGWVIESGDQAMFMAEDLADLPSGHLYEFWVIDAGGNAVAAGTLTDDDGVVLVPLERNLEGAALFAVTVEAERVDQSANDPVMVAAVDA